MADTIGRITVPTAINAGQTFRSRRGTVQAQLNAFAGFVAFLAGVRFVFACGTSGANAFFSDSVAAFIFVSPNRAAVVIIRLSGWEQQQVINGEPMLQYAVLEKFDGDVLLLGIGGGEEKLLDHAIEARARSDATYAGLSWLCAPRSQLPAI
jgi:hypothetical protein